MDLSTVLGRLRGGYYATYSDGSVDRRCFRRDVQTIWGNAKIWLASFNTKAKREASLSGHTLLHSRH